MILKINILILLSLFSISLVGKDMRYVEFKAKSGDATYLLFKKYELQASRCNLEHFKEINNLPGDMSLIIGKIYKLPVMVFEYNAVNIRTTIENNDFNLAKRIQTYNEEMLKKGLRDKDYREDNMLWVPYDYISCMPEIKKETGSTTEVPILGENYKIVKIIDNKLEGNVYYIIAGHGGPDPGAMGNYNGSILCEDEYAYDIALRMAKSLIEHSATVYLINRDKNDGIRDDAILKADKDEVFYKNKTIPLNQISRLDLACSIVNELYAENLNNKVKKQIAINLHVDSRSSGQRIDMFFYHKPDDMKGKEIASALRDKVEEKYNLHQKNRGYYGSVKPRNLHMLRKTIPTSVFIELGNIRNSADQKRFIEKDNRQAVANWLVEGLMECQ
jgi:N-acetylmuramoyl-L-alanine amidase